MKAVKDEIVEQDKDRQDEIVLQDEVVEQDEIVEQDDDRQEVIQSPSDDFAPKKLSFMKKLFCYGLAFVLVSLIAYGITGFLKDVINYYGENDVTRMQIGSTISAVFFLAYLSYILGNHWRASEKNEIGTAVTNFPNPFYDPGFQKGPLLLRTRYNELHDRYEHNTKLLLQSEKQYEQAENIISVFESKIRVMLRHNDNANRLLKSFNFLIHQNTKNIDSKMLKNILEECITVLEKDQSDKSVSLFGVHNDRLHIIESVRINAESIAKRFFTKGEGFAGDIWSKGESEIVNQIKKDDYRFDDQGIPATPIGSIMGIPLKVNDEILGVLCMQSESADGFSNADFRTVDFYARMCTLIILYDKINNKEHIKEGGGDQTNV